MSSPTTSVVTTQSPTPRNPRRRQRKDFEETGSLRSQPLRKRSKVSGNAFRPVADSETNGNITTTAMNGHALASQLEQASFLQPIDIPVRGRPQPGKRVLKNDGGTTLTKNANYVVKQLPSLPQQIRAIKTGDFRGVLSSSTGLALSLTQDHAYVWNYTSTTQTPKTRVFNLPHPSQNTEPLPLGALVTTGSASDTGLVVVTPTSGKIIFWENIETADTLSLFENRKSGVEGSVGSLFSGEKVTHLEKADVAGFILILSSGRTAQLTLRDAQSRPAITVKFLRAQKGNTGGGLLGGLKSVFGGSGWLKNVVAVKSRISAHTRGQVNVTIASEDAIFQIWQLGWSGQALFREEFDARSTIEETIKKSLGSELQDQLHEVKIIDIAIASDVTNGPSDNFDLVVLLSVTGASYSTFALVEVDLKDNVASVRRTLRLRSYAAPLITKSTWKPRLCLPRPYHTAFVIFEKAVVMVSLATIRSVELQLRTDLNSLPEPFQDTIYLRDESDSWVVGAKAESNMDNSNQSAVIIFVKNVGLIRIVAFEPAGDEHAIDRATITAKSKIEQAIFYGTISENPLNLFKKSDLVNSPQEIETAALEISKEILSSESVFVSAVTPSMTYHLEQRARALNNLALHLKHAYPILTREGRWSLRWDAEKMAAAQKIWSLYDAHTRDKDEAVRLLPELINYMPESHKTEPEAVLGELDPVRHWFLKDVGSIENMIAWAFQAVYEMHENDGVEDMKIITQMFSEADDIVLGGLETAFEFRTANAWLYSLEDEPVKDGILQSGYEGLPQFWTSTHETIAKVKELIDDARGAVSAHYEHAGVLDKPVSEVVIKVARDNSRLVEVLCSAYEERIRWCMSRTSQKTRAEGGELKQKYEQARLEIITGLSDVRMAKAGMSLAEKHKDMQALVTLVKGQSLKLMDELVRPDLGEVETANAERQAQALEGRVRSYFKKFGTEWADAFYSSHIRSGHSSGLLNQASSYQYEVTRFLRASSARKKLSWINDVLGEKDYALAGKSLMDVAASQEQNIWCKKVELSLAKLSLLAAKEAKQDIEDASHNEKTQKDAMALVNIEEKLYAHVKPSLCDAMDQAAEIQLAMEAYGRKQMTALPALQQLLERGVEKLVSHTAMDPDQLIDVLTLMNQRKCNMKNDNIAGQEFLLAFQALKHANFDKDPERAELLLRIIWRRCFIRDDWGKLNNTGNKSDQAMEDRIEATALYKTFYWGFKLSLWDGSSVIRCLEPDDVLGAGSHPDNLQYRFASADLRQPIARDMATEDRLMLEYMKHDRLTHWVTTTRDWAKQVLEEEAKHDSEQREQREQMVAQIQQADKDLDTGGKENEPGAWDKGDPQS